uniref:Uncharacterized protein n=1 Tax=Agrobacterium albertimagni TaxID=147266 RepID=A0A7C1SXT7_9HYPH
MGLCPTASSGTVAWRSGKSKAVREIRKRKEPGAGGGCARLLNLIGNWEEEEYCRSYRAALGGGVRRFDDLFIPTARDSAKRACCNAAVRFMHGSRFKRQRAAATFASTRFRIFRIGAFF